MARLRRSDSSGPGISRRGRGRGFEYRGPAGERIEDRAVLARIAELAIPPAWREVWICDDEQGHLQATGIDAAGRKQYLYHERWRVRRDRAKFDAMLGFGRALPRVRRRVRRDLDQGDLSEAAVLACAVRLLDLGYFRIGSEDYTEQNESYGLSTLLKCHLTLEGDRAHFDYRAKSGIPQVHEITDREALPILRALKRRRGGGEKLLVFRARGRYRELHAEEINAYLKDASGGEYSAKDFRTWNATVLAAAALAVSSREAPKPTKASRKRAVSAAIGVAAAYLGNTPAVCRASYVDPRVIDRFHAGHTVAAAVGGAGDGPDMANMRVRARIERAVVDLLEDA